MLMELKVNNITKKGVRVIVFGIQCNIFVQYKYKRNSYVDYLWQVVGVAPTVFLNNQLEAIGWNVSYIRMRTKYEETQHPM